MKKILFLLLFPAHLVFAQPEVSLEQCYEWAQHHYPKLQNSRAWQEISALNKENVGTSYLPKVTLNAQASYQSDVPQIDIQIPNMEIPSVSKDQYKAYFEFKQNIWDGGIASVSKQMEDNVLSGHLSQLEIEIYKLNDQVSQAFFTALITEKQAEVLQAQKAVLQRRLSEISSAISSGMAEQTAGLAVQAELLRMEQQNAEIQAMKKSALAVLAILTGREKSTLTKLMQPNLYAERFKDIDRPEIDLFEAQKNQLSTQIQWLEKTRNPKLFGFGQAGFGKPGLNMLSNDFDSYYLLGVGISWNALDWKNTQRKKKALQLQKEMVQHGEQTFRQNIRLLLEQQNQEVIRLKKVLETDEDIVSLRAEISKAAASKLKNEIITSSDYIQEIQAETASKLTLEIHKIQLLQAQEKHQLILGKSRPKLQLQE